MKSVTEATMDNYALAYVQRRSWVLGSWAYGAILAASGSAYVLASAATGVDPETGALMAVLGAAISALGWLASAPKRFTRKLPKPSMDVWRAEQSIRIDRGVVIVSNIAAAGIILALAFTAPRGTAPDFIPILAMLSVWAPLVGVLILRVRKLLIERGEVYDRWLRRREAGNG